MTREDLRLMISISSATMSKISANEPVSLSVIDKICGALQLQPGDILEYVDENGNTPGLHSIAQNEEIQIVQNQPKKRGPKPKNKSTEEKKPKDEKPINNEYSEAVKYKEEFDKLPGMDVFDRDYPQHKPGIKVTVEEYSKWKLDLFNRPQIPVVDEDLIPPDNMHKWKIARNGNNDRYWEFAYSCPPDDNVYWMNGPSIDYQGENYKPEDPNIFPGSLML